jgi:hypothetical protein
MKILVPLILILLYSCTDRASDNHNRQESVGKDKILVDSSTWAMRLMRLANTLNLPRIDKGVDSFELRLWSSLSGTDLQILTILRFSDSAWCCTESRYWVGSIDEWGKNRSLYADSVFTRRILPKTPFNIILDTLNQYELFKLPSQHEIPGFVDKTADGMNYTLEISTSQSYKVIKYRNPQYYNDTLNRKITSLLKFLNHSINAFVME